MYPYDPNHAQANDLLARYRAEADHYRLVKMVKGDQPGSFERLVAAIGQGLASIGESFKRPERRPSLPTV